MRIPTVLWLGLLLIAVEAYPTAFRLRANQRPKRNTGSDLGLALLQKSYNKRSHVDQLTKNGYEKAAWNYLRSSPVDKAIVSYVIRANDDEVSVLSALLEETNILNLMFARQLTQNEKKAEAIGRQV